MTDIRTQTQKALTSLLGLAAKAHVWHWLTRGPGSYAQHQAFGSLYKMSHDLADAIAEPAMGDEIDLTGIPSPRAFSLSHPRQARAEIIAVATDLAELAQALSEPEYGYLLNVVQGAEGELRKTLFLLELE